MRLALLNSLAFLLPMVVILDLTPAVSSENKENPKPQNRPLTVKVAAIQCSSDLGDIKGNRAKLTALVKEAAQNGAKIVVLPETSITGYLSQDLKINWHLKGWPIEKGFKGKNPLPFAETVPGPSTKHFSKLAKELKIYLTVPFLEVDHGPKDAKGKAKNVPIEARGNEKKAAGPRFFNTVCLLSPKGEIVGHYRKLTPWPHPEQSWATPGDRGVQVHDSEYGRMGLGICFDIHTILEKYKPHKIWALLYPIAWVDENHPADWFWHQLPQRVAPFKHYLIGANWSVDKKQPWFGYGFSLVLSPDGKVLATAKSLYGSEIVYATIKTALAK